MAAEMERFGMTVCCSHTGCRGAMDIMRHTARPVIFSHVDPRAIRKHRRSIRDEAICACAATGARHIGHVVQMVGIGHAGIGIDCVLCVFRRKAASVSDARRSPP
jgi:membrane dipeptidase